MIAIPQFQPEIEPVLDGYSEQAMAQVRRAEFEGGYSQRSRSGPNSVRRTVPVQFVVPEDRKKYIVDFLGARAGSEAFLYQLPWDTDAGLWTVEQWSASPIGTRGRQAVWRINFTLNGEFDIHG